MLSKWGMRVTHPANQAELTAPQSSSGIVLPHRCGGLQGALAICALLQLPAAAGQYTLCPLLPRIALTVYCWPCTEGSTVKTQQAALC